MIRRLLLLSALLATGCTRMRLVLDLVPAADELTETEVLRDDGVGSSGAKIALVDLSGLIVDTRRQLPWPGENPVARFTESLKKAARDRGVKALIVRINSPGGTVTASDVLYRELTQFKQRTHKPVVILMGDVAASGGYYVACAGDEIIAHPTTVTGSIGVIMQTFNFAQGMRKIGIKAMPSHRDRTRPWGHPLSRCPRSIARFCRVSSTSSTRDSRRSLSPGGLVLPKRIFAGSPMAVW